LVILKAWVRDYPDPNLNCNTELEIAHEIYNLACTIFYFNWTTEFSKSCKKAQNKNQSLNSAVRSVKKRTGGRILSAKTIVRNGQRFHKIKVLLPSGKVQTFKIKAQ